MPTEINKTDKGLEIKTVNNSIHIIFSDILFIKSSNNFLSIETINDMIPLNYSMSDIFEKLPKDNFIVTDEHYIVNLDKVSNFYNDGLFIEKEQTGFMIPIGKNFAKQTNHQIVEFIIRNNSK